MGTYCSTVSNGRNETLCKKYNYVLPRSMDTHLIRELDQLEDTIECMMRTLIEAVRDLKRMIKS